MPFDIHPDVWKGLVLVGVTLAALAWEFLRWCRDRPAR
jgi:hypothetical protein